MPVRGVILSGDDALFLAAALRVLDQLSGRSGLGARTRVRELERQLARSGECSEAPTTEQTPDTVVSLSHSDGTIGTDQAARLLGCSRENVRGLCRRGALPAIQVAGRWQIPADAVTDRLTERATRCRTSTSRSTKDATSPRVPPPPSPPPAS
ncbi:helix-turn-helix domain-containing protein [Gordonia sp. NPDC062954]|uniref:helix-turn-helix domain-containing protein n=1 Tax=Gordonia sp. NPDC062954 TaxID=3364003 RepID=UPI0037C8136D